MNNEYKYDEGNSHFPFFMLTMVSLVTLPLTYNVLKPATDLEHTAARVDSDFKPQDDELIQAQRRKQKRKVRKTKRMITVVLGYIVMAYLIYTISVTQRTLPKLWDPYEVLGVSRSASEKEIDRFYKRLSVKYHPDKAKPDASKNETIESINDRWVEMSKAYKALTDEDIRNNYLMYGNPDGKQATSVGIAIPKWLVEEGNRAYVVLFYAALLGVFLPYTVGKWWYGTQALTKDRVLHASAGKLFREYKEDISEGGVVGAVSAGEEFQNPLKGANETKGAAKIETKIISSGILSEADIDKLKKVDDPVQRKALALLWAYLGRIDLGDEDLNRQKYEVAPIALQLNNAFTSISLPFGVVSSILNSYHNSQNLIQAVPPSASPLLQLPYFTPELSTKISKTSKLPMTIQRFMSLPAQARRSLCKELSDTEYKQATKVASQIPHFQVAKAFFKVIGDRVVTPGSLVQLVIKGRIIPPGTKNVPEVNVLDLEDIDPEEGDLDALHGRKSAKSRRRKTADGKYVEDDAKDNSVQPPLANAPYFAADHAPRWHVFLADSRAGRVAVPPFTFTAFDRQIFNDDGTPTFKMLTLRCQFQAPPQVHAYLFTMHMLCDSYIGFDSKVDVILDVKDVSEANVVESEDEISEPDEGEFSTIAPHDISLILQQIHSLANCKQ